MAIRRRIGPFTITTGPTGIVVASTPWMLNSSVQIASTAASTTGRYSGKQPAITALIATFSTVAGARSGATIATTSSGARVVPASIASTRREEGATTGRPSVQPRANSASASSSSGANAMRRDVSLCRSKRTASSGAMSGSTLFDPQPGRHSGRPSPNPVIPVSFSQSPRCQPTARSTSAPFSTRSSVGTVSMWCW